MSDVLVRQPYEASKSSSYPGLTSPEKLIVNGAMCLLGYKTEKTGREVAKAVETLEEKTEKVFTVLGIEPFSMESVEKYKRKKIYWGNKWASVLEFIGSKGFGIPLIILGLGGLLVLALQTVACFAFDLFASSVPKLLLHPWQWVLTFVPFALMVSYMYAFGDHHVKFRRYSWNRVSLASYKEMVPLFALSRATSVVELLPEAKFHVDSLLVDERVVDPFLVLEVAGKVFYLDVWDEPKFEGRRTK
jgi:hypothetical protein